MEIKDRKISRLLERFPSRELIATLSEADKDDYDGMSELEIVKQELDYLIEDFQDQDIFIGKEYKKALELKEQSSNFKMYDIDVYSPNFKENLEKLEKKYDYYREIIEEFERLKQLKVKIGKLNKS